MRVWVGGFAIAAAMAASVRADTQPGTEANAALTPPGVTAAAAPERQTAVMLEPLQLLFGTLAFDVERQVAPHVGVALLTGIGYSSRVEIGDRVHQVSYGMAPDMLETVDWVRVHAGVQSSFYLQEPFRGPHLGVEVTYKHFWATSETGTIPGSFSVLTGSVYGGWKWLFEPGVTVTLQLGISAVGSSYAGNWDLDSEGTLNTVHLFGNLAAGWSL